MMCACYSVQRDIAEFFVGNAGGFKVNNVLRLAVLLLALVAAPVHAGDVAVAISIGEPGFYGRIELGDMPRPRVIYTTPVVIERRPSVVLEPVYLRVPRGHLKHWRKHCRDYDACGRPVYFVEDRWYTDEYAPHYRERVIRERERHHEQSHDEHGDRDEHHGHGHGKGHDKHGDKHGGDEKRDHHD